jgi:hypothetical protein
MEHPHQVIRGHSPVRAFAIGAQKESIVLVMGRTACGRDQGGQQKNPTRALTWIKHG